MAGSQKSFEAREERFSLGNDLIQSWADYGSTNPLISKAGLPIFITEVASRNTEANSTQLTLSTAQGARAPLVFTLKDTNPACLQKRIEAIESYLAGEFKKSHAATRLVKRVRLKMHPQYPKKKPGDPPAPRGSGRSPMEKSFASAVGHGQEVVDCITSLGAAYAPPDPDLLPAAMQALVDDIKQKNKDVTKALEPAGNANRARKTIYDGTDGMQQRIASIKSYLGSFKGGKKSDHYIEFSQAIKGT